MKAQGKPLKPNFLEKSSIQNQNGSDNGFRIGGTLFPETIVELILSKVPIDNVLKCNMVCRAWNELIRRKSLWKKRFENKGVDWEIIPVQIRDKPDGWTVLYAHLRYEIFARNYIANPSGHAEFEGWTIFEDDGDGWIVEEEPVGCFPISDALLFGRNDRCCFTTSYFWCSKYYMIDMRTEGLTPAILELLTPFQIKCSQMYASRVDCGSLFNWEVRLLNSQEKILRKFKSPTIELSSGSTWHTSKCIFQFGSIDVDILKDLKYILFIHEGKDSECWAGHYGIKLARSCVTMECLDSEPENTAEEEQYLTCYGDDGGRNTLLQRATEES